MKRSCDLRPRLLRYSLRSLQLLGCLIDHFTSDQVILDLCIPVGEASALLLLILERHFGRSGFINQDSELVCHVGMPLLIGWYGGIGLSLPDLLIKERARLSKWRDPSDTTVRKCQEILRCHK